MRLILAGGGSAGHVTPNLALLPAARAAFDEIFYFGSDGMESRLAKRANLPFYRTDAVKLNRSHPLANLKIPYILHKSVVQATNIMKQLQPSIVFVKGGYVSLPAAFAALKLGVPLVVHESDYTMGVANRLLARRASVVLTSFPETRPGRYVGLPVRPELFRPAPLPFSLCPGFPTVLIFGGSQGAAAINRAVEEGLGVLCARYNLIHITGEKHRTRIISERYYPLSFCDDMGALYAAADAVVLRGGANSLAECAALGKRALCIPLPKGESRGDQLDNAKSYQKRGYTDVLLQPELSAETLLARLERLLASPAPAPLSNDAAERIVCELVRYAAH